MRLRYLRISGLPPLNDVIVPFGHEPMLNRQCSIRFIVGVNGSGKSRLLQTLVDIFLHLERPRLPPFVVTLAYDLKQGNIPRTIYLHHPDPRQPQRSRLIVFESVLPIMLQPDSWQSLETLDLERLPYAVRQSFNGAELPSVSQSEIEAYLPGKMLAYTSGVAEHWETLFARHGADQDIEPETFDLKEERSVGWSVQREIERQINEREITAQAPPDVEEDTEVVHVGEDAFRTPSVGLLVLPLDLKLAVCAVTLDRAIQDFQSIQSSQAGEQGFIAEIQAALTNEDRTPGLRGLLNVVDWLWPVTIVLKIAFRPEKIARPQARVLEKLYNAATDVVREPGRGVGRLLMFDLQRNLPTMDGISTAAALFAALGGQSSEKPNVTPFDVFERLREWYSEGLVEDVTLLLQKRNVAGPLLYEWLSDGERMFLGRMALFHLLRGVDNALIILDEPETHFNDVWKREIVDIIDESLGDQDSDILISTHSSIALSDVFDSEITVLQKDRLSGAIDVIETPMASFGALPSEIMRGIFGAPDSVGRRATEFLELMLVVAALPEQVQTIWDHGPDVILSDVETEFQQLLDALSPEYKDRLNGSLLDLLRAVRAYTQSQLATTQTVRVVDALRLIEKLLGPGYYQFEFRRRLRALTER